MYKNSLSRFCDQQWLIVTYLLGAIMFYILIWNWDVWGEAQIMSALITIATTLHIFEEDTLPGGFPFMNNINVKSEEPRVYPINRFTNMFTNLGCTVLFMTITLFFAKDIAPSIMSLAITFAVTQVFNHTLCGFKMKKRYADKGKKTIYSPGTITCWTLLMPLAVYGLEWLLENGGTFGEILLGIGIYLFVTIGLIIIPCAISTRIKSREYSFRNLDYFEKYEN